MKYLLLQITYIYLHALVEVTLKNCFNKLKVVFPECNFPVELFVFFLKKSLLPSQTRIEMNIYFLAILILDSLRNLFSVLWIPESVCGHFLLRPSSPTSSLSS